MKNGLIYFHQGWSDIINCLSLINIYSEKYDSIKVLIRSDAKEMFDFYIRDKNNVTALYFDKEYLDANNPVLISNIDSSYATLFHGYHDIYRNDSYRGVFNRSIFYVEGFYTFYNIDFMDKVNFFGFERDLDKENFFYDDFIKKYGKDYIVFHSDESRDINIYLNKEKDINYVNLNGISNNIFETIKVLENSKEIHIIDSIWATFCYLLDTKYHIFENKNIYLYPFLDRSGSNLENTNTKILEPIHPLNWKIKN
jgi:hypothetical protein